VINFLTFFSFHFLLFFSSRPITYLTVRWYKAKSDGGRTTIETDGKYLFTAFKRRLYIRGVDEGDSGTYMCEGELSIPGIPTTFTSATASANLTVQGKLPVAIYFLIVKSFVDKAGA